MTIHQPTARMAPTPEPTRTGLAADTLRRAVLDNLACDRAAQAPPQLVPATLPHRPAAGATLPDVAWHGERLHEPPWHDAGAQLLAFTLASEHATEAPLHVVFNMSDAARTVAVPVIDGYRWRRALDAARFSPDDIVPPQQQTGAEGEQYLAQARSVVVLEAG